MSDSERTLLLAVDTSTRFAGVGLDDGEGSVIGRSWRSEQNHGRELLPAIMDLLAEFGGSPSDLAGLAVAKGPGGFSALRVGIGTVIGLAAPRRLPVAAVSTHEVEAAPFFERTGDGAALYSLLPAGRGEVSWARFECGRQTEAGLADPLELAASVPATSLFCGEAAMTLSGEVDRDRLMVGLPPTRDPATLLALGREYFRLCGSGGAQPVNPEYVREPSITLPRPPQ